LHETAAKENFAGAVFFALQAQFSM
jgi:hypothetical protein